MRQSAIIVGVFALLLGSGQAWAQDAAKPPCPAGQANSDSGCVQDMPATQHQQEVLKGGAEAQQGQPEATGEVTGATTGTPTMPETQHQQEVLKKGSGS